MAPTQPGFSDVLIGLQYGDEGKARVIDMIAHEYDVIARFNGGANAGHTIATPRGRIALKQLPSGVFHAKSKLYIGSGCALNLWKLAKEIRDVEALGVDLTGRLFISARCAVVQPAHILQDERNGQFIGTTGNGMGPCYADRALRMRNGTRVNLQLRDLFLDLPAARDAIAANLDNDPVHGDQLERMRAMAAELPALLDLIKPYLVNDPLFLTSLLENGAKVLFEGAQSVGLDVVGGEQPFVTASHTVPGYAYVGGDLSARYHRKTIGVAKAVMSRVGQGPFPTELGGTRSASYCEIAAQNGRGRLDEQRDFDPLALLKSAEPFDVGVALRMITDEYGTGTGRPRRIGILDLVQLKAAVRLHGVDALFVTKCDCLSLYAGSAYGGFPVATGYADDFANLQLKTFGAFELPDNACLSPSDLPAPLMELKDFIETVTGARIFGLGLGPERDAQVQFYKWT